MTLFVGWYKASSEKVWRQTPPMETEADARKLARQAALWLRVKSYDTAVLPQGEDPNKKGKK